MCKCKEEKLYDKQLSRDRYVVWLEDELQQTVDENHHLYALSGKEIYKHFMKEKGIA